jgi:hypothetical protein
MSNHVLNQIIAPTITCSRGTTVSLDGSDLLLVALLCLLGAAVAESLQATWIFVILGNTYDITARRWRADGDALINAQEFWFALGMTVL